MTESISSGLGHVRLQLQGDVALLTIDRPAKLNAIGPEMLLALEQHLASLDRNQEVRAVVLTGAGDRAFSVGADVHAWTALEPLEMWRSWVRDGHRAMQRLASLRQPTIAAVNGFAFGGGLELALAADIRIAAASATFAMPETKIGTLPGWYGTRRLPDAIGYARAKQMIFTGASIDTATAERWGLISEIVPDGEVQTRAFELAAAIAANAPIAVQLAKATIDRDAAALEAFAGALAAGVEDAKEGIAAFREKRTPRFTGR